MPKVTLVSWTNKPLQVIHAMTQNMMGNVITDLDTIDEQEAIETIRELQKTSLGGPIEYVDFTFQVQGVPRALTHQMVRTRVGAVYSQESLRFVAKAGEQFKYNVGPSIDNEEKLGIYNEAMLNIQHAYEKLLDIGVATQDARGVLPINILTNIGVKYNLKTLMGIAEVRLCTQSQPHWVSIIQQMKQEIADKVHPVLAEMLVMYCDRHKRCGYESIYDRKCPKQELFK
ncbi:MAG: FAD-dependent thymidylate synthase [bacterium]|nr:FAD-dependent thymidylate synthase [bacterium]